MPGAGAAIFGCAGPRLSRSEADFFRDADPFGFILFARNVLDPDQLRWLTTELCSVGAMIFTKGRVLWTAHRRAVLGGSGDFH